MHACLEDLVHVLLVLVLVVDRRRGGRWRRGARLFAVCLLLRVAFPRPLRGAGHGDLLELLFVLVLVFCLILQ